MSISADKNVMLSRFREIRKRTEIICAPLQTEDFIPQPVIDVSPPKWHLAHTSWFFETFILNVLMPGYKPFHPQYNYIFNSYYDSVGERVARADRGNLSRPTLDEVYAYRNYVNEHVEKLISGGIKKEDEAKFLRFFETGLQHEQQHQELLITDIKYILGHNPLMPAYIDTPENALPGGRASGENEIKHFGDIQYMEMPEGIYEIGFNGNDFCWDNEKPLHKVFLHNFKIANRLVTNGEYLEFMNDGGYKNFRHWLSEGWFIVQEKNWEAPLYWYKNKDGKWMHYTVYGPMEINENEPVTHISFYEADAYATWAGKRLLTEFEWEAAAKTIKTSEDEKLNFAETEIYHPYMAVEKNGLNQMHGNCWEWTYSSYHPYPNYKREPGPLGEYNGKFMLNQMVLRGGSCATPQNHYRPTYRNFFHPDLRWQFNGIRLAQ